MNFPRAAELHTTAGCTLNWAVEMGGPEGYPFLQPAGPPFCAPRRPSLLSCVQPTSPPKFIFHLETQPSSPAISVIQHQIIFLLLLSGIVTPHKLSFFRNSG